MPCAMTRSCVWSGERMMSCSWRMSGCCMIMACVMGVCGFGLVVVTLFQLYKYWFVITCSCCILSNFWSIVLSFLTIVISIARIMNRMVNNM